MTVQIVCDGPGPHDRPGGVLGTADKVPEGMNRCGSPACAPPVPAVVQNEADLRAKARQALEVNATYLALGSPSAAQNTAQIRVLTRECNALIRLMIGAVDDTSGT